MSQETDYSRIAFGRGGEILDVPKNEELLEKIRATPVLEPKELLELAKFYQWYPTNQPLAKHLTLVALMRVVQEPGVKKALLTAINPSGEITTAKIASAKADDPEDFWEVFIGQSIDDPREDQHWFIRRVPISGIELLIETPQHKGHRKDRYYVIGVSPSSASLESTKRTAQA
ncbi:MAG: hypothetical protein NVS4B1_07040 [Ktedonobacteraceae bacterium]